AAKYGGDPFLRAQILLPLLASRGAAGTDVDLASVAEAAVGDILTGAVADPYRHCPLRRQFVGLGVGAGDAVHVQGMVEQGYPVGDEGIGGVLGLRRPVEP